MVECLFLGLMGGGESAIVLLRLELSEGSETTLPLMATLNWLPPFPRSPRTLALMSARVSQCAAAQVTKITHGHWLKTHLVFQGLRKHS